MTRLRFDGDDITNRFVDSQLICLWKFVTESSPTKSPAGAGLGLSLDELLAAVEYLAVHRMALPLIQRNALPLMRLAEQASGPSGFRAFALVVHRVLRSMPVRPYGARVGSGKASKA